MQALDQVINGLHSPKRCFSKIILIINYTVCPVQSAAINAARNETLTAHQSLDQVVVLFLQYLWEFLLRVIKPQIHLLMC